MASTRLITKPFVAVTAAAAAFFLYVGILVPIMPTFVDDELGAGEIGVGLSLASFAATAICVRPVIARLIDRFGRRPVMIVGSLIAGTAGMSLALVDELWQLLVLRGVAGVGEAALFIGAATIIADLSPPDRRAEAASYLSLAVFGGLGVGPIIGDAVLGDERFARAFVVAGAFAWLSALLGLAVPRRLASSVASETAEPLPRRQGIARVMHPAAVGPGLVLACGIAGLSVFTAFLPDHARDLGLGGSGALFAAYSGVCLLLRFAGARSLERLGAHRAVPIAFVALAAALTSLAVFAAVWALWVAAVLIGVASAFLYPSLMALTVNRASDRERPLAISSFTMFFEVGNIGGGLAFGAIAQLAGKRAAFGSAVVLCAIGTWVLLTHVVPSESLARRPARRLTAVAAD